MITIILKPKIMEPSIVRELALQEEKFLPEIQRYFFWMRRSGSLFPATKQWASFSLRKDGTKTNGRLSNSWRHETDA